MTVVNNAKEINYGQIMKIIRRKLGAFYNLGDYRTEVCIEALNWYASYLMLKFPNFSIFEIRSVIAEEILSMELSLEKIRDLQKREKEGVAVWCSGV